MQFGKTGRDVNIELFRVVLMFGICLLHSVSHSGNQMPWMSNGLKWCVDGFAFVSGWYGVRFAPSKVIRFLGMVIASSVLSVAIGVGIGAWNIFERGFFVEAYKMIVGHWYVSAYVMLMLIAPLINVALDRVDIKNLPQLLMPLLVLLFWSWTRGLPVLVTIFPNASGLGDYTCMSLTGVYVFARVLRRIEWFARVGIVHIICVGSICLSVCILGYGGYASFCAMMVAAYSFAAFKRMHISGRLARFAMTVAPSMFPVLLLSQKAGWTKAFYAQLNLHLIEVSSIGKILYCFCFAMTCFSFCLFLDMPRRLMTYAIRGEIASLSKCIDDAYVGFCNRFGDLLGRK